MKSREKWRTRYFLSNVWQELQEKYASQVRDAKFLRERVIHRCVYRTAKNNIVGSPTTTLSTRSQSVYKCEREKNTTCNKKLISRIKPERCNLEYVGRLASPRRSRRNSFKLFDRTNAQGLVHDVDKFFKSDDTSFSYRKIFRSLPNARTLFAVQRKFANLTRREPIGATLRSLRFCPRLRINQRLRKGSALARLGDKTSVIARNGGARQREINRTGYERNRRVRLQALAGNGQREE